MHAARLSERRVPRRSLRTTWGALIFGALVFASCSSESAAPETNESPASRQVGQEESRVVGSGQVVAGTCVDLPLVVEVVSSFTAVSCVEEHDGQIAAVFDLTQDGDFPGSEQVVLDAETGCRTRFEDFVGISYQSSIYFLQSFTPSEDSWVRLDDRTVICVILPPVGNDQLTGDLRGAAE